MSPYRMLFFLLIFSLFLVSCSTTKGIKKDTSKGTTFIENFSVLESDLESLLFKARIETKKNELTGILLIKKIAEDSATHVVFLSEIGLNLLNLKYKNDEFELVGVKDFLNKPAIIKAFQKDFRMILQDMDAIENYTIQEVEADTLSVLEFKHKSQRYSYFYKPGFGVNRIKCISGLFKTDVTIGGNGKMFIGISHRPIRLDITLEELKKVYYHVN